MTAIIPNFRAALILTALLVLPMPSSAKADGDDGIVKIKSAVSIPEAVARIKKDIASKGIKFFMEIGQSKLAADAKIKLRSSTLLVFGIHRSAHSSSPPIPMPGSTGRSACC